MTFPYWERRLLAALGLIVTDERVHFLQAWAACEGGNAHFNPLNTTMKVSGSRPYNSAGVQNFPDELAGLAATLLTLRLPYYAALRTSMIVHPHDALAILTGSGQSLITWGTGTKCIAAKLAPPR